MGIVANVSAIYECAERLNQMYQNKRNDSICTGVLENENARVS